MGQPNMHRVIFILDRMCTLFWIMLCVLHLLITNRISRSRQWVFVLHTWHSVLIRQMCPTIREITAWILSMMHMIHMYWHWSSPPDQPNTHNYRWPHPSHACSLLNPTPTSTKSPNPAMLSFVPTQLLRIHGPHSHSITCLSQSPKSQNSELLGPLCRFSHHVLSVTGHPLPASQ